MTLSLNTQAILLLTAPLIAGRREDTGEELLSPGDYNRLARSLREAKRQPSDLLATGPEAQEALALAAERFGAARLEKLLARGFQLSQAVERWNSRAIWVVSRADPEYPRRLKAKLKEDAPPVLYGCGDAKLLDTGGLAVVGSRHVDDAILDYTTNIGRLAAQAGLGIVSGGARGIDRAAMSGGLQAGGVVIGVLSDSLERAALERDNREPLMESRLVFISACDPAAGFNVGNAMQRNKYIYALADAALVINSDYETGGTWAGAIEQLTHSRFGHFCPLFARAGADAPRGNHALVQRGAKPWPEPMDSFTLTQLLAESRAEAPACAQQEELLLTLQEEPAPYAQKATPPATSPETNKSPEVPPVVPSAPAADKSADAGVDDFASPVNILLETIMELVALEFLEPFTEAEVAARLEINKAQAKVWLQKLLANGKIEKVKKGKSTRYQVAKGMG